MQNLTPRIQILLLAIVSFTFTGCTEERAVALKAAVENFSNRAVLAIDAVVDLHLRGVLGKPLAEEKQIKKTKSDLVDTQKNKPDQLMSVIDISFDWLDERKTLRSTAFSDFDKLKVAYKEFSSAYQRLPEGSVAAAKDVACSAVLGARLVKYMADAGKKLAETPVPLASEIVEGKKELQMRTVNAVLTNNDQNLDEAVRSHVALLKEQEMANSEVVAKLADAAEAGSEALDLIERYNDFSISDALKMLRRALVIREKTFEFSSKAQIERLDNLIAKLNSKPALAKALQMPVGAAPEECK